MTRPFLLASLAFAAPALAQPTNIDPAHKYAWSENCGWLNFRDSGSPAGVQGARINAFFMSGFVWGENIGSINLGDGSPSNGTAYANLTGLDFGVNVLGDSRLGGLAWGENIGWINFGPFATLPSNQQARYDVDNARLRGYAWGENIGWINLDHGTHFVGVVLCAADLTGSSDPNDPAYGIPDSVLDASDFFFYLDQFVIMNLAIADLTGSSDPNDPTYGLPDGVLDASDFFFYLDLFVQGCP